MTTSESGYIDTAPFWEGAREGRLMVQYCPATHRWQAYPRPASVYTGLRQLEWRAASGRGVLASWTVDRMAAPAPGHSPRVHALVDLAEGPRLVTWLHEPDLSQLRIGQRVRVHWVELPDGRRWPAFRSEPSTHKETS